MKATLKGLKEFDDVVFRVATRLKLRVLQNWNNAKGADGNKFTKPLTQAYKDKKESTGRDGIRNLLLSGNMAQDLDPVKKQDFVYVLKWKSATERKKALGNYEHAPNMMQPVSDSIDSELQNLAFKLYKQEKK